MTDDKPKAKPCSIVMAYYDNPIMLSRHIDEWLKWTSYTSQRLRVVVVDDGSPDSPAADVVRKRRMETVSMNVEIEVYRVGKDIPWNQDGARNLGMGVCDTEFALLTDMDHLLPACQAKKMLDLIESKTIAERTYLMPKQWVYSTRQQIPVHPNTFLFRTRDFWSMGGYDEDFAGFYGSDGNFRKCAKGSGLLEKTTDDFGLIVYRSDDVEDANTRRYGRKDSEYYSAHNPQLMAKRKGPAYQARNPIRFEWTREI